MGEADYYSPGDWNLICDISGKKMKSSIARHRWDGAVVHPDHWEPRHPQEFVRGVRDDQSVPYNRPALIATVSNLGDIDPVTQPGAPIAPSTLIVTSTIVGQVDLIWIDNSADETGFVIERKLTNLPVDPMLNGHLPLVGRVGTDVITFSDFGLQSGKLFDYQVSSVGSTGALSTPSNRVSIVVL